MRPCDFRWSLPNPIYIGSLIAWSARHSLREEPGFSSGLCQLSSVPQKTLMVCYSLVAVSVGLGRTSSQPRAIRAIRTRIRRDSGHVPQDATVPEFTWLLVDGDIHSIQEIEDVMSELEKMGLAVHTTVFAPPGRGTNRKWSQFFQQSKITFHPVKRNSNHGGEANDNEIVKALQTCTKTCSFALLTSDFDFLGVVQQAAASNKKMFVFIPAQKRVVIDRYRSAGVQVYKLQPRIDRFPRVTAMLHQNGEGQVQLGDPCRPYDSSEKVKVCTGFLQDLGYVSAACREYLVHATTKFWLSNNLGSLTVFPQQLAIEEVWQLLRDQGGKKPWKNYKHDMAFVLPMTSVGKPTKKQLNKFGSALARRVFMGGGPCMLQDSTLLVSQALRQLGYLDEDMNADLFEAMLVFINCTDHRFLGCC